MHPVLADSAQIPGDLSFYNFVLFIHIISVIVAFGVIFVYPVFFRIGLEDDPRGLPYFHRVQDWLGPRVITGGATVALLAGIYLAIDGPFGFDEPFVGGGLAILIVILGLGGAFFAPRVDRLRQLAERDVAAAGAGQVKLSDEYVQAARQVELVGYLASGLVLIAVLLMVFKPGT